MSLALECLSSLRVDSEQFDVSVEETVYQAVGRSPCVDGDEACAKGMSGPPEQDPLWQIAAGHSDSIAFSNASLVKQRCVSVNKVVRLVVGDPFVVVNDVFPFAKHLYSIVQREFDRLAAGPELCPGP